MVKMAFDQSRNRRMVMPPMSALGHKQKWCHHRVMSVITLKADILKRGLHVR
jgi:hypothetical protein